MFASYLIVAFQMNCRRTHCDIANGTPGARKLTICLESATSPAGSSRSVASLHDHHQSQPTTAAAGLSVDARQLKAFDGVKLFYSVDWPLSVVVTQASFCCMLSLWCPAVTPMHSCQINGQLSLWRPAVTLLPCCHSAAMLHVQQQSVD